MWLWSKTESGKILASRIYKNTSCLTQLCLCLFSIFLLSCWSKLDDNYPNLGTRLKENVKINWTVSTKWHENYILRIISSYAVLVYLLLETKCVQMRHFIVNEHCQWISATAYICPRTRIIYIMLKKTTQIRSGFSGFHTAFYCAKVLINNFVWLHSLLFWFWMFLLPQHRINS